PGIDTMSGLAGCSADHNHTSGNTTGTPINGFCTDRAGNRTDATYTLKYDTTAPTLVPDPVPDPNAAGWHRQALTIKFPGTDGTSGIASCTADRNHTTGDTTGTPINGFCTDHAGNRTDATYTLKYDASPPELTPVPSREPDRNDWYNRELTVRFPGTDATSGIATCTADQRYSTPDSTAASVPGLCTDQAGNTTARAFGFKYDDTAPLVTGAVAQRPPEPSGWYVRPVTFDFVGSDALAGIDVCADADYDGPDGAAVLVSGRCVDKAGNVGEGLFPLKYDDTGPGVRAVATRDPDVNGWYNDPLTVRFVGSDDASGLASCVPPQEYGGPDTVFGVLTGTCRDNAGNVGLGSLAVMYDATAPQVDGASADRAPDGNGWYNRPLTVSFHGSDATSGIDACTVTRYIGPDNPSASLAGSCSDRAGNPSGPGAFPFKYDTAAPTIAAVKVQAGNRTAALSWEASPDTSLVEVVRSAGARRSGVMVYRGSGRSFRDRRLTNGVRYHYRLTGYDEARNSATREVAATPTAPLLSPQAGAVVSSPPRLVWKARRGATYYNVQVWRGRRIFSAWPTRRSLQLPREWTYRGRRYRLTPGRYRWYVWPGLGRRAQKEFGPLLGSSSFVVR
ncbi:MAG: Neogenin, partial [Gaiellaceae bacterium]|nr:Neogenin [Gaiellaceae bacterium]